MKEFYVYVMFKPNGSPCYVGKGSGGRWAIKDRSYNTHLMRIIKKYGELATVKVRSGLTEEEAFQVEIALISAIGRSPYGPLANLTDGGEGTSGVSEATIAKAKATIRSKKLWGAAIRGDKPNGPTRTHTDKLMDAMASIHPSRLAAFVKRATEIADKLSDSDAYAVRAAALKFRSKW